MDIAALGYSVDTSSVDRATQALERHAASAKGVAEANTKLGNSGAAVARGAGEATNAVKLTGQQLQNLSFQINDLATGLASGQSPFRVIAQQGAQIIQLFGPGAGVAASLRAVGTGITSFLVNPLTLTLAGFTAASAGAEYFFSEVMSQSERAARALETHRDLVDQLGKAYQAAGKGMMGYAGESRSVLSFQLEQNLAQIKAELESTNLRGLTRAPTYGGAGPFDEINAAARAFSNDKDILAFRDRLVEIGQATNDPAIRKFIGDEITATNETAALARAYHETGLQMEQFNEGVRRSATAAEGAAAGVRMLRTEIAKLHVDEFAEGKRRSASAAVGAPGGIDSSINSMSRDLMKSDGAAAIEQLRRLQELERTAMAEMQKEARVFADEMDQVRDVSRGFSSDFLHGIMEGKSAVDSLTGALSNLAGKLLDIGNDLIIQALLGKQGTTGAGLLGSLLFSGSTTSPTTAPNAVASSFIGNAVGSAGMFGSAISNTSGASAAFGNYPYASLIREAAGKYGLDPDLLAALIHQESGFKPGLTSPAGAQGLAQLMPTTARGLGVTDPFDPRQSIMGGADYLRQQMDRFGNRDLALAAYYTGPGNVAKYGISNSYGNPTPATYVQQINQQAQLYAQAVQTTAQTAQQSAASFAPAFPSAVAQILSAVTSAIGGGGGLFGAVSGGLFGGGRAGGGWMDSGKAYDVGEDGPERVFMGPRGGGMVVPNRGGGGRSHSIRMGDTYIHIGHANDDTAAEIRRTMEEMNAKNYRDLESRIGGINQRYSDRRAG